MIWVEVFSRNHAMLARYRCAGPEVRIGRGYDNDVVIDDPYVDARHIRIIRNGADALVAEDLGSANGLFSGQSPHRVERLVVDGDGLIGIGHTYLRIRQANHVVAPARSVQPEARPGPMLVALGAANLGIVALSTWLGETSEPKPSRYLELLAVVSVCALVWAGGWATLSRVFSGQAGFARNLVIALVGMLLLAIGFEVAGIAAFALSWSALATYSYAGAWGLLAVICFLHLRAISASRLWLKGGIVAGLAVGVVAMQTLIQLEPRLDADQRPESEQQSDVRRHMPPLFRLAPLQSESTFFAGAAQLKGRLDQDRAR